MIKLKVISGPGVSAVEQKENSMGRMLVVAMGEGVVEIDGLEISFVAGSVFFLDKGAGFRMVSGEVQVGHFLCFNFRYVDYFLLQYPLGRGLGLFGELVILQLAQERWLLALNRIRILAAELYRGAGFGHLKMLFSLLLLDMLEDRFLVVEPLDEGLQLKDKFHSLIETSFKSHRDTRYYAAQMGLTPRRLREWCKIWHQGKSVFEVVMDRLISESEFLLLGTDLPIKAIAYELGFTSGENFGTYFTRYRGITPKAFRSLHL